MSGALHLEINLFGIFILFLLFVNLKKTAAMMLDERLFRCILLIVMLILALDAVRWGLGGVEAGGMRAVLLTAAALSFALAGPAGLLWLLYVDYRANADAAGLKRRVPAYSLPLWATSILSLASPFTGWVFYINESNAYGRGTMFPLYTALSLAPLIAAGLFALAAWKREKLPSRRTEFHMLTVLVLLPMAGAALQIAFFGLPLFWICVTYSLLIIFINIQNRQISLDGLTNINNRRTLNRYLETRYANLRPGEALYMIIIDIDNFKGINDTYGHTVGDTALVQTADILKRVCGRTSDFLARYGGDEFAIVCIRSSTASVEKEIAAIHAEVKRFNDGETIPYRLVLSVGCAKLDEADAAGIDGLISAADRQMYNMKRGIK